MTDSSRNAAHLAAAPSVDTGDAFSAVTALLWREREVLERLLFKLVEQQLILTSGNTRWLNHADAEVRDAVASLQDHEIVRAAEVDALVRRHGLPADATLRQLAETAPEPWPMVLLDHREALRALTLEIDSVATENKRTLQAGESATREALEKISGRGAADAPVAPKGYGRGDATPLRSAFFLDEQA